MRWIPRYENLVEERFSRLLDLYLAPRKTKYRLNIDPQSLIPKLPDPDDLRPFPSARAIEYKGHTGRVHAIAFDPSGEYLASCDQTGEVRVFDVMSSRCVERWNVNDFGEEREKRVGVSRIAWSNRGILAVAHGLRVTIFRPAVVNKHSSNGDDRDAYLRGAQNAVDATAAKVSVEWSYSEATDKAPAMATMSLSDAHAKKFTSLAWHPKGDYLATVCDTSATRAGQVLIHHVPKRKSQNPFPSKQKRRCPSGYISS